MDLFGNRVLKFLVKTRNPSLLYKSGRYFWKRKKNLRIKKISRRKKKITVFKIINGVKCYAGLQSQTF